MKEVKIIKGKSVPRLWLSRKLWMTGFVLTVLWLTYQREVKYLHSFTDANQIIAFSALTRDFMVAFTAAALGYLGINGVVQWRHGSSSEIIEKYIPGIIEQGQPGAPETRPWSAPAVPDNET